MCLIAWNWRPATDAALLVVANRDEFYARPARAMHWWGDSGVLAGQDLQAGGAWLGLHRNGRFAALTNYRDPLNVRADAPSRGALVLDFLHSDLSPSDYLAWLAPRAHQYNPFNLLLRHGSVFLGFESRANCTFAISPGIGAVSNADFDTPWPKLVRLKSALQSAQDKRVTDAEVMFSFLANAEVAADAELPQTGIPLRRERALSAAFIKTTDYGTRACTVVQTSSVRSDIWERSFDDGGLRGEVQFNW
jgi:uncharacterized protein with NRDE domain